MGYTKVSGLKDLLSIIKKDALFYIVQDGKSYKIKYDQLKAFLGGIDSAGFLGVATPSTNPTSNGFYIAKQSGTYTNFGNFVISSSFIGFAIVYKYGNTSTGILIELPNSFDGNIALNQITKGVNGDKVYRHTIQKSFTIFDQNILSSLGGYSRYNIVFHQNKVYMSNVNNNMSIPGTNNDWGEIKFSSDTDQEFNENSENTQSGKSIANFFLEKIDPVNGYNRINGIIKYPDKEFKSGAITDSVDCDLYVVPIANIDTIYIDAFVGSQSNRRAIYAFNSNKSFISGGYINDFLNSNSLTEKKAVQKSLFTVNGVAYVAFNNLKSNVNVGAFATGNYQTFGKIKKELIEIDSNRYYTIKNLIPSNLGTLQIHKAQNNTGIIIDESNYIMYKLEHAKISNGKLVISLPITYPFINVFDSNDNFIRSISIQPTIENVIDLNTIEGSYIIFSFSSTSTASGWFSLNYSKNNSEPIYNFLDYDYLYGGKKNRLSQHVTIQSLVDKINKNGSGTIYFPAGTYSLAESIVMKSNVSIQGDGEHLTIFKPRGRVPAFIGGNKNDYTSAITNVNFCDFSIDGELQSLSSTPYNSDIKGIHIVFLKNVTFRNLLIKNTGATGLGCDFFQSGLIENVRAENCGRLVDLTASSAPGASGIGIGTGAFMEGIETLTISNCHAINCGQNGIFIERQFQPTGGFNTDHPVGTTIIGCTARGCRIGFGTSGNDNLTFIGCTAYGNHHANYAYDIGTMNRTGSFGKFVKFIGCISKKAGKFMPENYPLYSGDANGYGWYVKGNYDGIELTNCDSTDNLKDGFFVKAGLKNLYINGGRFADNAENGINLNGTINKFKISPSVIENNNFDGLRIDGNLTNGFIKDSILTTNKNYGINKVNGTLTNVLVKDNLVFTNTLGQLNNITQS